MDGSVWVPIGVGLVSAIGVVLSLVDKSAAKKALRFTFDGFQFDPYNLDTATGLPALPTGWKWIIEPYEMTSEDWNWPNAEVKLVDGSDEYWTVKITLGEYASDRENKGRILNATRQILGSMQNDLHVTNAEKFYGEYPPRNINNPEETK
jgi:hypothetical protein